MIRSRYDAHGPEAEFEPGSRGRVLRNRLGIVRVREMQQAESEALLAVQEWAVGHFSAEHRFTAADICLLHRQWLGGIYPWAGDYRSVNVSKGGFMFATAAQVPRLMRAFEQKELAQDTPCAGMDEARLVTALARTHAELVLIHPFREGNGRCARLLAWLMALQAGFPALDFSPMAGRGKRDYIAAVHQAVGTDYQAMENCFRRVLRRTWRLYGAQI
jgi:cell filamentation protein